MTESRGVAGEIRSERPLSALEIAAALVVLAYVVLLGGTGLGELHPVLRIVNGLVAGGAIAAYLVLAPRRHDRIDAACLAALVVFLAAAVLSAFPRQSLDGALGALTFTAAFFLARLITADEAGRRALVWVLIGLSAILTTLATARWLPPTIEWWTLTGVVPPLDMNRSGMLWGHRHDLALVVAVLYPAWWIGRPTPFRVAGRVVFGLLTLAVVFVDGSRTNWLALGIGGLAVAAPFVLRAWRTSPRARVVSAAVVVVGGLATIVSGLAGTILDRLLTTNTLVSRSDMWGSLVEVWLERPINGLGPGSFPWLLQRTAYFDANSWAPRHPDSLPFQVLPELGLLGVVAIGILAVALLPAIVRAPSAARFALVALVAAGIGSNPTEFAFLMLVAIAWAALAVPRVAPVSPAVGRRWPRAISLALLALIGLAFASTAVAALAHDAARRSIANEDLETATRGDLWIAQSLDPGMALYPRLEGAAERLQRASIDLASSALERAISLNPNDDLAWRTLALVQLVAREPDQALESIDRAVELQRSDATNLLLRLSIERRVGAEYAATAGEIVQAWPWIVLSPEWDTIAGRDTGYALDAAIERAADGAPAPQSNALAAIWVAALAGDDELLDAAAAGSGLPRGLAVAYAQAVTCDPEFGTYLQDAPAADRRFDEYWALRVRMASVQGLEDVEAMRALDIMTDGQAFARFRPLNALDENGFVGLSADAWGYRRPPVAWPDYIWQLPSPDAAYQSWLLNTSAATDAAREFAALEDCR